MSGPSSAGLRAKGRSLLAPAALACALALALAGAQRPAEPGVLLPADLPGLPNFAWVSPRLCRGAQPTREGFERLRAMGVVTVVNLRAEHSDREEIAGLGFRYVELPFTASRPEEGDVAGFLRVASDPASGAVFVHCHHGADRTGYMVAAYRMAVEGWSVDRALEELPRFGFHAIWLDIPRRLRQMGPKAPAAGAPARPAAAGSAP